MDKNEIIAYLKTWIQLNRQEVYGSAKDFIDVPRLLHELDKIKDA